jgi:hypothetical protein
MATIQTAEPAAIATSTAAAAALLEMRSFSQADIYL